MIFKHILMKVNKSKIINHEKNTLNVTINFWSKKYEYIYILHFRDG